MILKILPWFLFLVWNVIIYSLSDIPNLTTNLGIIDLILRKVAHMVEYAILYFLWRRAYSVSFNDKKSISTAIGIIVCILIAISDEIHQSFVPGRKGSWKDVLFFDTLGIVVMAFVIQKWYKIHHRIKL
ncbi:MAG: VanZ family protein [bacterium]